MPYRSHTPHPCTLVKIMLNVLFVEIVNIIFNLITLKLKLPYFKEDKMFAKV